MGKGVRCPAGDSDPKLPFGEAENCHSTLASWASLRSGRIPFNRLLGGCWNRRARNEPVAGHDCQQLLAVWRPAGIHNSLYIQKVLRTQVRGKDDECLGSGLMRVAERMDGALGCMHPLTRCQIPDYTVNGIADEPLQGVYAFFIVGVTMWRRNVCSRGDSQLEDAHTPRGGSVYEIAYCQATNCDWLKSGCVCAHREYSEQERCRLRRRRGNHSEMPGYQTWRAQRTR